MESILHTFKGIFLFCLGSSLKNAILLGDNHSLILDLVYYVALIWLVFRFILNYKLPSVPNTDFNVCIIGAGFSGIGMGVKLKEMGVNFRIIEKGSKFGGTWWDNQYPGCACDIPSHLYSFSFALNPNWSKSYSPQPEICRYLQNVAKKHRLEDNTEFGKKVMKATWNNTSDKWTVDLDSGESITANVIVSGSGILHKPAIPEFKGKTLFKGESFHTAQWNKDCNLTGKRVAVIGTGASAVQTVPSVAPKVKHLIVFQRTPCWVPPKEEYNHPAWLQFLFRVFPFAMFLLRNYYFWKFEFRFFAVFRMEGILRKIAENIFTNHIKKEVKDPEVAKKLTPSFEPGCKRVTPSNTYLQSFNRENVTLVTEGIDCITADGIKTKDGEFHNIDIIIYATGFSILDSVNSFEIYGLQDSTKNNGISNDVSSTIKKGKITLAEEWADQPNAYKAITYPGYPNLFLLLGPGSGLGHNTVVYMIECQIAYTVDAMRKMIETNIKSINLKKEANDQYQNWVQQCMKNKVFSSPSCKSWYKNDRGINYTLWPTDLTHYWWITRKSDLEKYHCKY